MPHTAFQYCERGWSQSIPFAWIMLSSTQRCSIRRLVAGWPMGKDASPRATASAIARGTSRPNRQVPKTPPIHGAPSRKSCLRSMPFSKLGCWAALPTVDDGPAFLEMSDISSSPLRIRNCLLDQAVHNLSSRGIVIPTEPPLIRRHPIQAQRAAGRSAGLLEESQSQRDPRRRGGYRARRDWPSDFPDDPPSVSRSRRADQAARRSQLERRSRRACDQWRPAWDRSPPGPAREARRRSTEWPCCADRTASALATGTDGTRSEGWQSARRSLRRRAGSSAG